MLLSMRAEIQQLAEILSTVTGLDIEVVDKDLIRVAGTGVYSGDTGKSVKSAGNLLKASLQNKIHLFIENPRENSLCQNCKNKEHCQELLAMCTPIADADTIYGAIELVCFTTKSLKLVRKNSQFYIKFLHYIANNIAQRCKEKAELLDISQLLDVTLQTLNTTDKSIMLYDNDGKLVYYNDKAQIILEEFDIEHIKKDDIRKTGITIGDDEEFSIECDGKSLHVFGKRINLSSQSPRFHSVFIFDTMHSLLSASRNLSLVHLNTSLSRIIGSSPEIILLKEQITATAETQSTVLITGESGTGKELVARAIHSIGDRANAPFIAINCGAIPDTLLESELFGYIGGAFTGASRKGQIGKFEMAEGGVLFLDEISSMPLYLQVKLLRALQERVITRLGSSQNIHVDIRIIAATNDNLLTLLEKNTFRKDLYYRLNVIPLQIPPLRNRIGDLDLLIPFFVQKYCSLFNKNIINIPKRLLAKMKKYNWPGNVRELENNIEYLVNMSNKFGKIDEDTLYDGFLKIKDETLTPLSTPPEIIPVKQLERKAVFSALEYFGNDTTGKKNAAKALGISLSTLYRIVSESDVSK